MTSDNGCYRQQIAIFCALFQLTLLTDGTKMMEPALNISFEHLRPDNSSLVENWEILLRIVGDFEVSIGAEPFYREQEFCVVEFGVQAVEWSRKLAPSEFVYRTLESDEPGFVFIKERQAGWQIGSIYQTKEAPPIPLNIIRAAIEAYWNNLREAVQQQLQRDISPLLDLPARTVGAVTRRRTR